MRRSGIDGRYQRQIGYIVELIFLVHIVRVYRIARVRIGLAVGLLFFMRTGCESRQNEQRRKQQRNYLFHGIFLLFCKAFQPCFCTSTEKFRRARLSPFLYLWTFMLFIIILRINTFLLKINTKPVKSSEKFFLTMTYYYIRALLSILFTKVFLLDTKRT